MADTYYNITRIVFDIEKELTQVYMFIHAWNDVPIGIEGWHHKTFPPKPFNEIIQLLDEGDDSPLLWPQKAPPIEVPIYEEG